ncbi:MAG TPA: ribonuclease R family protein [Chlamydiales bacterium]|nr:ribonuclease R family protein [Chlamydiales bacterium]
MIAPVMKSRSNRKKKKKFPLREKVSEKRKSKDEFPLAQGSLSVHPRGFGFVKTGTGPDVFIPKHRILNAVDGDEVEVEITSTLSPKGPEGSVVAILKRSRSSLAGTVISSEGNHRYLVFAPLLGKEKPLRIESKETLHDGDRIICHIDEWDDKKGGVKGTLIRRIGPISDPSIDIEAAIAEFELPDGFSKEALAEAKAYESKVPSKEIKERLDLTKEECVTIDPDTAKDFDDAITLTQDEKGHFHLGVHIADVAHYVKRDSHLDKEAFERCNSTYFPGKCVPMLPEELSNELCSLKPKVNRLTESVLAEFSPDGTLISYQIAKTVIKSQKRFSYEEAFAVLEKKKKSLHAPLLERMVALCLLLKKKRFERGSIDFSMAENRVMVDEKGVPLRIERIEYDITHQMIEEFMLKANEIVAIHLSKKGRELIYRVHEAPSDESFKDFYAFARSLGFHLPPSPTHVDIQKLFREAKDSPLLSQLSVSFIRSMRLAAYSSDNIGHYGLALEHYCHFTSPIRRYTDLIIQRLLFDEIPADFEINAVATKCSEKERVSFRAESSVVVLKKLRLAGTYFKEEQERIYPAVVTRVKPFALFFEVKHFDLEGSLHVSKLGNDYFEFDGQRMQFRGVHTGKSFTVGQEVFVRLIRIDYVLQETEWVLVLPPSTKAAIKKK